MCWNSGESGNFGGDMKVDTGNEVKNFEKFNIFENDYVSRKFGTNVQNFLEGFY